MVFLSPFSDYTILRQNLLQIHVVFCLGAERVQHFSVLVMLPRTRIAHSLAFEYVRQAHKRAGLRKNDCQRWFHQAKEIEEGRGGEERKGEEKFIYFLSRTQMNYVYVKLSPPHNVCSGVMLKQHYVQWEWGGLIDHHFHLACWFSWPPINFLHVSNIRPKLERIFA